MASLSLDASFEPSAFAVMRPPVDWVESQLRGPMVGATECKQIQLFLRCCEREMIVHAAALQTATLRLLPWC
eukprot:4841489-Amphidinium_carterae.1